MSSSNRSVDMIVSVSLSLTLSSKCLYLLFIFITFFHLPFFSEPIFISLILCISADCFVLQCFDTVGWAVSPVKIVPRFTYYISGGTVNLNSFIQSFSACVYRVWKERCSRAPAAVWCKCVGTWRWRVNTAAQCMQFWTCRCRTAFAAAWRWC